ncbi:MAG: UDP-N-acetylmuramate--L-alanine ligase [Planctomycetes bacterium]|nr:UDP-N-acetylmuramate--L-alanine ligase [Planctomycetota bacterium]
MLSGRRIHFVGAGGIGMSALALLVSESGAEVSGCDLVDGKGVQLLRRNGIPVDIGHSPSHVAESDIVVFSSAVPRSHPELAAVEESGAMLLSREHMLSMVMRERRGVGVTGAHGKTTTTWLLARILAAAGFDPTVLVGGIIDEINGNFRRGKGEIFVTEVDESNGIVADFHPFAAVVTNVDDEHLDRFSGRDEMADAVRRFLMGVKRDGLVVLSADDPILDSMAAELRSDRPDVEVILVGFSRAADVVVSKTSSGAGICGMDLPRVDFELRLPGDHNLHNAALAAVTALRLGASPAAVASALSDAPPVHRRQELIAELGGIRVLDDYAHHPTEITATFDALRSTVDGRFVAVFQPHRYTRTRALADRFIDALAGFDYIILMDIYPASEPPIEGVSSADLARRALDRGLALQYVSRPQLVVEHLLSVLEPGDTVITLGAGDVSEIAYALADRLR